MKPHRVQLSRKKGWRLPPNTVVVSRPSKWANPYRVGVDGDARECVRKFGSNISANLWMLRGLIDPLRGKNLACWCSLDEPCHADVLLELSNR